MKMVMSIMVRWKNDLQNGKGIYKSKMAKSMKVNI